jgi:excisionase family DNA binding protein
METGDRLLTPGEVAALFRVDPKVVTRWAAAGRISSLQTPGGHRRFRESEVRALLEGEEGVDNWADSELGLESAAWPPEMSDTSPPRPSVELSAGRQRPSDEEELERPRSDSQAERISEPLPRLEALWQHIPDLLDHVAHPYLAYRVTPWSNCLVVTLKAHLGDGLDDLYEFAADTPVPVNAYLDTDDPELARNVIDALDDLVRSLGFEDPTDETIEAGSIWRRARVFLGRGLSSKQVRMRLASLERVIELRHIDKQQAEVDAKTSEALTKLIQSLEHIREACMQAGSILLIKYEHKDVPVLLARQLSHREMWALERFPEIQTRPRDVLQALALASESLERVHDEGSAR